MALSACPPAVATSQSAISTALTAAPTAAADDGACVLTKCDQQLQLIQMPDHSDARSFRCQIIQMTLRVTLRVLAMLLAMLLERCMRRCVRVTMNADCACTRVPVPACLYPRALRVTLRVTLAHPQLPCLPKPALVNADCACTRVPVPACLYPRACTRVRCVSRCVSRLPTRSSDSGCRRRCVLTKCVLTKCVLTKCDQQLQLIQMPDHSDDPARPCKVQN
jgi:hypothetical protein